MMNLRQEKIKTEKNLLNLLHSRKDDRGANIWLVVPNDRGVFHGSSTRDDIVCVHPALNPIY